MSPYQLLRFEADRMPPGSHRIVCPFCSGGSEKEASLSLHIDERGALSFRCYRASCGVGGGKSHVKKKGREPRHFLRETQSLTSLQCETLKRHFGFVPTWTRYSPEMDRYVYTVRDPIGVPRGHIARSLTGATPKVLTYDERPDQPFIGWVRSETSEAVVIVEDWISAEKLGASTATGVALNGTHLSLEMVTEIQVNSGGKPVCLALDRDAYGKSIGYLQRYGDLFSPRLRVAWLEVDIKHVPFGQIERAIKSGTFDFGGARGAVA